MQHGAIVEQGTADEVLNDPQHAYTKQLIAAVPPLKAPPPRMLSGKNILTIDGVSKTYRTGGFLGRGARITDAVKNVSLQPAARRDARHRRRIRLGQIDAGALHRAADRSRHRLDPARRQGLGEAVARRCPARDPPHPDGVPGSVRLAQSAPQGGRAGGAGADRARHRPRAPAIAEAQKAVRAGRARSLRRRPLPARILRRPARSASGSPARWR